jgi:hypothetical protein
MRLELETSRESVIREAEKAVQQIRAREKETRTYTNLLGQANSTRQRYEAEKKMLINQIEVEMKFVRSSMEQIETLQRDKEKRIRETREEVESNMKQALLKSELEAAELRKRKELEVIAERERRETKLREEIREKEDMYLANKRRENALFEASIKAQRAEYLQNKKRDDERILAELRENELTYSREREHKLELFAIEKRQSDEEYSMRSKELLDKLHRDHEARVAATEAAHAQEMETLERELATTIAVNKIALEELYARQRKENDEYILAKEATLAALKEEHEHVLSAVQKATLLVTDDCKSLKQILEQKIAQKAANDAQMSQILTELNATTLTNTQLEESIFSMRMRLKDTTDSIDRLTGETQTVQTKLDQLNATKLRVEENYNMYQNRLTELAVVTDAATAKLEIIEAQSSESLAAKLRIEQQLHEKQTELHKNTLAISIAEKAIEAIKTNISSLVTSRIAAEQSTHEIKEQLKQSKKQYEESETRRRVITEELAKLLPILTTEQAILANSEQNLAERRQQLENTEKYTEALRLESENITRAFDETHTKYNAMLERNADIEQEIKQISDSFTMLDQSYAEMVASRGTMNELQKELRLRNIAENKLLNKKRAELAELEKSFEGDNTTRKSIEETYRMAVAEHESVMANSSRLVEETAKLKARYGEKAELEQKTATVLSSISSVEQELAKIRATTIEQESILTLLLQEKEAALLKSTETVEAIARAKYEGRIRASLNEKVAAKRRSIEEMNELLQAQKLTFTNKVDKTALARKRAIEEALAARTHIEKNPVRIYILCHNAERFEKAGSIYKNYPWAHPILMKYQDCTFENAVWKQLYEIRDEWYNYKMVGTMSFSAHTKINLNDVDRIVKDPATWATGFYHFMRTDTPISNKNHPHLVEIMTDVCRDLNISIPPENFCNYWITSSEKMIQFLIWYEERAYPTVMAHPLIMTDSTYPGSLSKDHLMTLCGVPYYPHATFVFERMFLSFFMSLNK